MNRLKRLAVIAFTFLSFVGFTQVGEYTFNLAGRGAYTTYAMDYQALGINVANLGLGIDTGSKRIAIGTSEMGITASSKLFNNTVLKDVRTVPLSFGLSTEFKYNDYGELATDLQDGLNANVNSRLFGGAITVNKVGTFALSVTGKYQMSMGLSKDFSEILTYGFGAPYFDTLIIQQSGGTPFRVQNTPSNFDSLRNDTSIDILAGTTSTPKSISDLIKGTNMSVSWYREFAFGFGRKIIGVKDVELFAGASVKYIQGIATFNLSVDENDEITTYGAYSPSLGSSGGFLTSGNFSFTLPQSAGQGFGFDFGATMSYKKKLIIGVAANDIGSVTWKKNTFTALGDPLLQTFEVGGFYADTSASSVDGPATFDSVLRALINIQETNEQRTLALPSNFRIGFGLNLKYFSIGVDVVQPFNKEIPGSLDKAIYSFGGTVNLGPVRLSTGAILGGNYVNRIPFGIVYAPGGRYEVGISTQDITSVFTFNTAEKPVLSGNIGFARLKF